MIFSILHYLNYAALQLKHLICKDLLFSKNIKITLKKTCITITNINRNVNMCDIPLYHYHTSKLSSPTQNLISISSSLLAKFKKITSRKKPCFLYNKSWCVVDCSVEDLRSRAAILNLFLMYPLFQGSSDYLPLTSIF